MPVLQPAIKSHRTECVWICLSPRRNNPVRRVVAHRRELLFQRLDQFGRRFVLRLGQRHSAVVAVDERDADRVIVAVRPVPTDRLTCMVSASRSWEQLDYRSCFGDQVVIAIAARK